MATARKQAAKEPKAEANGEAPLDLSKIQIDMPVMTVVEFRVTGTDPYLQLKFSGKARDKMMASQAAGEQAKSRKKREQRKFEDDYFNAMHRSVEGWYGIPATAFKNAMVSACRLAGIPMTRAKLLVHVEADGRDAESGDPLIKIEGDPEQHIGNVRNANGSADLRVRAMWKKWSAIVRVEYDSGCIGGADVYALLYRAGKQVGIGEGRPDSKKSCGMGMGRFSVEQVAQGGRVAA